jgi:hypothetical protein
MHLVAFSLGLDEHIAIYQKIGIYAFDPNSMWI